jgi:hypothetical protein
VLTIASPPSIQEAPSASDRIGQEAQRRKPWGRLHLLIDSPPARLVSAPSTAGSMVSSSGLTDASPASTCTTPPPIRDRGLSDCSMGLPVEPRPLPVNRPQSEP